MDFTTFRINHDLYREVMRLKDESIMYHNDNKNELPRTMSVRTCNANRYQVSYAEWVQHVANVSKVENRGNFTLDLQSDLHMETPITKKRQLTEFEKKILKDLSYKPLIKKEPVEFMENVAA